MRRALAVNSPTLLVAGQAIAVAFGLITSPIVARTLGPDGRGETAAALALFLLIPIIIAYGMPLEVRRRAAMSDGKEVLRTARIMAAWSSLIAALLAVTCYATIFADFSLFSRLVASVGILLAPISVSWMCDTSVLVAHQRYRSVFAMRLTQPTVYLLILILFCLAGKATTGTVLLANLLGLVATFTLGIVLTRTSMKGARVSVTDLNTSSLRFSGNSIAEAASTRVDQVIALPLIGGYEAGIYSVAVTVASIPIALGQALGAAYFRPIANESGPRIRELQAEAVRSGMIVAGLCFLPCLAGSILFMPVVFGSDFDASVPVACISLIGSSFMIVAFVASMALAAVGEGVRMTISQIAALAIGIGCLFIFGPMFGAIGAAIASTINYTVLMVFMLIGLSVPFRTYIVRGGDIRRAIHRLLRD